MAGEVFPDESELQMRMGGRTDHEGPRQTAAAAWSELSLPHLSEMNVPAIARTRFDDPYEIPGCPGRAALPFIWATTGLCPSTSGELQRAAIRFPLGARPGTELPIHALKPKKLRSGSRQAPSMSGGTPRIGIKLSPSPTSPTRWGAKGDMSPPAQRRPCRHAADAKGAEHAITPIQ